MELEQLCILVLLCLLATSPHSTASTGNSMSDKFNIISDTS